MTVAASVGRPDFAGLLREMVSRGASDLHVAAGCPAKVRIDGALADAAGGRVLSKADAAELVRGVLTQSQQERFDASAEVDLVIAVEELGRFRINCFRQRRRASMAVRRIPPRAPRLGALGLPPMVGRFADRPRGLVLVAGPAGSGKSTTLAAMVDKINRHRRGHVVTIEDPVEFVHDSRRCLVSQREVGVDTRGFASGLKSALRQDPDVLLIGELRDEEAIQAALNFAETGHLVLATLHTGSAAESVNRIVDAFAAERQSQVRSQLSLVLEGVVAQALVRCAEAVGRVVAAEIMVCTPAVRAVIRDRKFHQLPSLIQAGRRHGMRTMNEALAELYLSGRATLREALKHSPDPPSLLKALGEAPPEGSGISASGTGSRFAAVPRAAAVAS